MNDAEKLRQFTELVAAMRKAQVAYFKTHGGLADCKQLERDVDRWLERNTVSDQRRLFQEV